MNIKTLTLATWIVIFVSGCHMYGDRQIKPHHHTSVHKIIVQKAYTAPKPSVQHRHPANRFTKIVNHAHPGGAKPHNHNYGRTAARSAAPKVILVKVVTPHGHHRHRHH